MKTKRKLTDTEIEDLYLNKNKNQSQIAQEANISRERVRQIINKLGLPTGREMLAEKREEKEKEKAKRRIQRQKAIKYNRKNRDKQLCDKYQYLQDLWESGKTLKEIENETGISKGSLSWIIGTMRSKFDWFQKRRPNYKRK